LRGVVGGWGSELILDELCETIGFKMSDSLNFRGTSGRNGRETYMAGTAWKLLWPHANSAIVGLSRVREGRIHEHNVSSEVGDHLCERQVQLD
jgi:hypothetical protein